MKREEISLAVGEIDTGYIAEAAFLPKKTVRYHLSLRRLAAFAAALIICLSSAVSALAAADVQPAYELLYAVSPSLAQTLKPVRLASEDNGIRMEVISAKIEGDTALIYISMQDLTGDRVDATTDLFDSYSINRPFGCSATCRLERYDEESGTACFLIQLTQWHGKEIRGEKITFSVSEFLSHKQEYVGEIPEIELSQTPVPVRTLHSVNIRGGSDGGEAEEYLIPYMKVTPADGASITALGFVGGKLHVQVHYEDILRTDNHGGVWLQDKNGGTIQCEGSVSFWDEENRGSYEEYIFPVSSPDVLEGYALWGDFTLSGSLTEGSWQVTFPLA